MLKFEYTNAELDKLIEVIHFTPLQLRIIEMRRDAMTRDEMEASFSKENKVVPVYTIDRQIKKISEKIAKASSKGLIDF